LFLFLFLFLFGLVFFFSCLLGAAPLFPKLERRLKARAKQEEGPWMEADSR